MKKIALAVVLCLVLVGIMAVPALAKAQKVDLTTYVYTPINYNDPADPGSGFVVFNNATGSADMEVSLKGALPDETYYVWIEIQGIGWIQLGTLETNGQGNGNFHSRNKEEPSGTTTVRVALNRGEFVTRFITDWVAMTIK